MATLHDLSPSAFENLVYDLASSVGFTNVVWRTPGADGGRDIEAEYHQFDAVGEQVHQRWYIECKRYRSSISWPTLYDKLAHADAQGADFMLLATNSNPSPDCESRIGAWNQRKNPLVRVWRGYQIESFLRLYPQISTKYGLTTSPQSQINSLQPLLFEVTKIVQSANAAHETGSSPEKGLLAAALIGELIDKRVADFSYYDSPRYSTYWELPKESWLLGEVMPTDAEEVGFSAFAAVLRYVTNAPRVSLNLSATGQWSLSAIGGNLSITPSALSLLSLIASWTNLEVVDAEGNTVSFRTRRVENA